jgi:hypothetical protein
MLWLLLLPIRLAFFLVFGLLIALPFLLLRLAIKATVALLLLPFVLLILLACLVFGVFAVTFALLLPLLPFAVVGFCLWLMMRPHASPAVGQY